MATASADTAWGEPLVPEGAEIGWSPFRGPQTVACAAGEFDIFFGGAKGGGKSDVIVGRATVQANMPAFKALILRETKGELEEVLRRAHAVYPRLASRPVWNARFQRFDFPNPNNRTGAGGASIKFGHCKTRKDVQLYQGHEWAEVYFDEWANVADARIKEELIKEIRCKDPRVLRGWFGSGNPGYAGHAHCKRQYLETCGKRGERVHRFELKLPNGDVLERTRRYIPSRITDNPVYANDSDYLATLWLLPEERRRQLLEGDWDAGIGLALPQLNKDVHMLEPFRPPGHWPRFGSFDWGFEHNWVFCWFMADEDGRLYVIDTLWGRLDLPEEIGDNITHHLGPSELAQLRYVAAGHDVWGEFGRARGLSGPTVAERLMERGLPLTRANQDRIAGLANLQSYTAWRKLGPGKIDGEPWCYFFDTPGNRRLFGELEGMVTDPNDPRKHLKVDADRETGEGGDDGYDAFRYGVASRPARADSSLGGDQDTSAWDPAVLAHQALESRRVSSPKPNVGKVDPMIRARIE